MANFFSALKRGMQAATDSLGPGKFTLQDKTVSCPHCDHQEFEQGSAQLNTAGMTLLNLDWANKSATILICVHCGQVQWFVQAPERI